jgi:glutamate dehydrogenase (NAD(P)+)
MHRFLQQPERTLIVALPVTMDDGRLEVFTGYRVQHSTGRGPAALEGQLTRDNAHEIRARIIVEGANGPVTADADRLLAERGVLIVPDILANAGGVVVSYFEWVQSRAQFYWELEEVEKRLEIYMRRAMELVLAKAKAYDSPLREAAFIVAVERVASAITKRGIFP